MCVESKSGDDSSFSLKAKHYGNHRNSLLYGGFLNSKCTYNKDTTTCVKSNEDTIDLCQRNVDATEEVAGLSSDGDNVLKRLVYRDIRYRRIICTLEQYLDYQGGTHIQRFADCLKDCCRVDSYTRNSVMYNASTPTVVFQPICNPLYPDVYTL